MNFRTWLESNHYEDMCGIADDLLANAKIDTDYDIPYVAGYSKDGKTFYIDQHVPKSFKSLELRKSLLRHESVEKAAEMNLKWGYKASHEMATKAERAVVQKAGIDWDSYDKFCKSLIKDEGHENLKRVPANLDLLPYETDKDYKLIKRMKQLMH